MSTVDTLRAWGILRPAEVVTLAHAAGLDLAAACALLEQESGGGRNSWGSDRVATGGAYVKGSEVTEHDYRAYRAALAAGRAGQQGVGPTQLTSVGFQDQADALGGCWSPVPNMRVGFTLLAGYEQRWQISDAFRAYNGGAGNRMAGSNANADRYSSSAMGRYRRWLTRLGPAATTPPGDDVPLTQADADLVARTLLNTPIWDLYPEHPTRKITVADTLGWAAAHAARAGDRVEDLRRDLAKASATGAPVGELNAALRAALDELGPLALVTKEQPR